jgi:hypothetical protein
VAALWKPLQSMPEYKDQTTFIISADHGQGHGLVDWKDHGVDQKGSENIWIAVIGRIRHHLGERHNVASVTQSQIAATTRRCWVARTTVRRCRGASRCLTC